MQEGEEARLTGQGEQGGLSMREAIAANIETARELREQIPLDELTGERPLFVPSDTPGYRPSYEGCIPIDANLVLEGGSMRVQFTCGVLDYLIDQGLFAKNIIGVSAGALSGFNYLMGARGRTCALNIGFAGDWRYMSLRSFLATGNAYNVDTSFHKIPMEWIPYKASEFYDSPCKLTAVVTNLETNGAEYYEIDDPIAGMGYLQASSSMPFVSKTVEIDGKLYLDGGVADTIPVDYSLATGVEKQIVVLSQDETFEQQRNRFNDLAHIWYRSYPAFAEAVTKRYQLVNSSRHHCLELAQQGRIFLIMPPERITLEILENDPRKLYEVYEMGYAEAERRWDELVEYLCR